MTQLILILEIVVDVRWKGLKVELRAEGVASTSRGLVGDTVFAVLPNVAPGYTFILTLLCQGVRHVLSVSCVPNCLVPSN